MSKAPIVEQYMTRMPHMIEPEAPLEAAHKLMRKFQIRHLPVLEGSDLVGLLSIRDLHLLETLKDVNVKTVSVAEAMSPKPYVVEPNTRINEIAAKMAAEKIGSAVVIDEGKVVGIFTTIDALIAYIHIYKP